MDALKRFIVLIIISASLASAQSEADSKGKGIIAGFGSSVCFGTGDIDGGGGYIGRIRGFLSGKGWKIVNVSRGGDNTRTILERFDKNENLRVSDKAICDTQYLVQSNPDFVIIGLSLANQGILSASESAADSVFESYRTGMMNLIQKCRNKGYRVVVTGCYANNQFSPGQYELTKKMNLAENEWGVPLVNFLGAVDDGSGRWVKGFYNDDWHPSYGGHKEMFYSFVPTLFDALKMGKTDPVFNSSGGFAVIEVTGGPALLFKPADTIHSFTVSFAVRSDEGVPIEITGGRGVLSFVNMAQGKDNGRTYEITAGTDNFSAAITISAKEIIYRNGEKEISVLNKGQLKDFTRITLAHQAALGKTFLYINGEPAGECEERLIPGNFNFGINGRMDLKDILIYRSCLNSDEVKALVGGNLIHASLDVYAPLSDSVFIPGKEAANEACSLSELKVLGKAARGLQQAGNK
jgi:lysophospholipase L1-like esterase